MKAETPVVVAVAATLLAAPTIAGGFGIIGASVVQILIGLGGIAFAFYLRRRGFSFPAAAWGLVALVGLAAFSMVKSESLYQSLRFLLLLVSYLLVFVMAANLGARRDWLLPSVALITVSFALSALGIREFATGPGAGWRVFATFANPNYFSGFLVMALPVTLAFYLAAKERPVAILLGLSVAFEAGALMLTASRFGIAAGALGVLVFLLFALFAGQLDKACGKRLLIVLVLAVPLLIIVARPASQRVAAGSSQSYSGTFRLYTWKATANMARVHPLLGTGAGTFEIAFPKYAIAGYTRTAHQTFLQVASEMGLLAPAALIFALVAIAWPMMSTIAKTRQNSRLEAGKDEFESRMRSLLLAGIFGGLLASAARNLMDSDWYVPALGVTFWLLAGWGIAISRREQASTKAGRFGFASIGVVSLVFIILAADLLVGALYAKAGDKAVRVYDLTGAFTAYGKATKIVPIAADYYFQLGRFQAVDPENPTMALKNLKKAANLEPTRARYPFMTGMILSNYGRYDEALVELQRATQLDKHAPRLSLGLADLYEKLGRHGNALAIYRNMTAAENSIYERVKGVPEFVEPAYAYAHYYLAMDALQRHNAAEAIRQLQSAVDRLERRRKARDMILAAQIAGFADPSDEESLHELLIDSYKQLAWIYLQKGQDDALYLRIAQRVKIVEKEKPLLAPEL